MPPLQAPTPAGSAAQENSNYQQNLDRLRRNLHDLKEQLAALLQCAAPGGPPETDEGRELWHKALRMLEDCDFLWRFLPAQKTPEYTKVFLTPLAENIRYWINHLERLTAERRIQKRK